MALDFRLRKHADFQRAYTAAGRKQFGKLLTYFAATRPAEWRSDTPGPRIGLTVPKALGNAVARNRIKRRMRAAVAQHIALLEGRALDIILHPKKSVLDADFAAVEREVSIIFRSVAARTGKP